MKKITIGSLSCWFCLVSLIGGPTGQYIELKTGVCIPQKKQGIHYKKAPCFSAELGISWESWRLGLQIGRVKYEVNRVEINSSMEAAVFDPTPGQSTCRDSRFTAFSIMANLYHDWQLHDKTMLYVGCGLGVTRLNCRFCDLENGLLRGEGLIYNQDKYLLAAQLMCGVSYTLNDHWSVSLGYRCMKMEKVKYNWITAERCWPSLKTPLLHSLEVGLRYSF